MYFSATAFSTGITLRTALRTSHKKLTYIITYVVHVTGEASAQSVRRGVRGSIVLNSIPSVRAILTQAKIYERMTVLWPAGRLGRDLNTWHSTTRSYATKSGKRKLAPVVELHKDFHSLAKH